MPEAEPLPGMADYLPEPDLEGRQATTFDDEWRDHKGLVRLLLQQGVPVEQVNAEITGVPQQPTVEDLATVNARLMTLAEETGIPRAWLLRQLERNRREGGISMSWLKRADLPGAPGAAPEMEQRLPTVSKPDTGAGPGGPAGPGPKAPPAPKGPPLPDGKPAAGVDEIKMLLEKGDLQGAIEALKKLLPGGGDKSPAPPHKAPNLGKPPEKPQAKEPARPEPKARSEEGGDGGKEDKAAYAGYGQPEREMKPSEMMEAYRGRERAGQPGLDNGSDAAPANKPEEGRQFGGTPKLKRQDEGVPPRQQETYQAEQLANEKRAGIILECGWCHYPVEYACPDCGSKRTGEYSQPQPEMKPSEMMEGYRGREGKDVPALDSNSDDAPPNQPEEGREFGGVPKLKPQFSGNPSSQNMEYANEQRANEQRSN